MELWNPPPGMVIMRATFTDASTLSVVEWLLWLLLAAVLVSTVWLTTVICCAAGTFVLTARTRSSEPLAAPEANVEINELPEANPETKQEAEPTNVDKERIDQKPTDTPTAEKENKTGTSTKPVTTVTRRSRVTPHVNSDVIAQCININKHAVRPGSNSYGVFITGLQCQHHCTWRIADQTRPPAEHLGKCGAEVTRLWQLQMAAARRRNVATAAERIS